MLFKVSESNMYHSETYSMEISIFRVVAYFSVTLGIEYVMDGSDISDILTRSSNMLFVLSSYIAVTHSFICYITITHHVSTIHKRW